MNMVERLQIGPSDIQIAAVSFSNASRVEFTLNQYSDKPSVINAILNIPYMNGWTNTAAGILDMRTKVFDPTNRGLRGDRPDAPNIAVVITDGASNIDRPNTIRYANDAKSDGITMLAFGITNSVDSTELQGISTDGVLGQTYWLSPDFSITNDIIDDIINRTCDSTSDGQYPCYINFLIHSIKCIIRITLRLYP